MRRKPNPGGTASGHAFAPLATAVILNFAGVASAATITVDNSSAASVSGHCTLVDAVISLNNQAGAHGSSCIAGDGINDTIVLPFSTPTSIVFDTAMAPYSSALALLQAVTISGNLDAKGLPLVTISRSTAPGTADFRLIETGFNLVLNNIALSNGVANVGGAVTAGGGAKVTLTGSIVSGNTASRYGGGIYTQSGTITLTNSSISDNKSDGYGAGICASNGSVVATGSTISGNSAANESGGGIYAHGSVTLTNTTISGNASGDAGGGIYASSATLNYATVAGNTVPAGNTGGGIAITFDGAPSSATSSLFYGNSPNDVDSTLSIGFDGDHNLIGTHGGRTVLVNPALTCNPHLGPLFGNGGATKTRPLFTGSCALDAGQTTGGSVTTDQRGLPRKVGSATDIGAFERQGPLDPPDLIFVSGFEP